MAKKQSKTTASTQAHLDIEDIIDNLVILKNGTVALVMSTTSVNFDLLSETEQDATIYAYGALLNSLSFPIEVLVRSRKADVTSYFNHLEEAERTQPNPDLKRQIQKYKDFIESTVQQKTVLDKKFYIAINYSSLEKGIKGVRSNPKNTKSKAALLTEAKAALAPRRDHIIQQTTRLGLTTKQLNTQELIELFYDIYNPAPTGTQRVLLDAQSYTTPIVEPSVEVPTSPPKEPPVITENPPIPPEPVSPPPPPVEVPQPSPVASAPQSQLRPVEAPPPQPAAPPTPPQVPQEMRQSPIFATPPAQPPLPPISHTPEPSPQSQPSYGNYTPASAQQTNALKGLQQATAKASSFLSQPQFRPNLTNRNTNENQNSSNPQLRPVGDNK
ncbi:MAG: hypothetical protein NUV69_03395 [Candidatus Curtissbacteria bacterium]|nr:hypothetical protein [Candidatus Curtissbacteria bacterium]